MGMDFTYFEHPEKYSPMSEDEVPCDICGKEKICFDGEVFFGTDQVSFICSNCLSKGKLMDMDIFSCEGDVEELRRQVRAAHADWNDEAIAIDVEQKSAALEKTTPHLVTWQDWPWPAADGDYCRFIGYGSRQKYASLSKDADGEILFKQSLYYAVKEDADADELWQDLLPEEDIADYNESAEMPVLFYVFRSLHSDRILTVWDSN